MKIHLISISLVLGMGSSSFAKNQGPTPTHANVAYGQHERTKLDFWQAEGAGPCPLLVYIHGGGWMKGDKKAMGNAEVYLKKGISVAAINYRLVLGDPLPAPVLNAARAVQFLRSKAATWNVDKNKAVLAGGSAGACSSLWIACHDDLANPDSEDPIERASTCVQGAGVVSAQTSMDPKIIEPWIAPKVFLPMTVPAANFNCGIHHGLFGVQFKEKSAEVGHNNVELYIEDHDESIQYANADDFVFKTLLSGQSSADTPWEGKKSSFHSFDQYDFKFDGVDCKVVVPRKIADGKPWVWRARFWGHEPQFDIALLERGYHVVYCHAGNMFGNAEAVKRWNAFYEYLRYEHLFSDRPVLEGMSRGGLIIYNWAAANPDKVKAIYADAPVMDFKSWPGGKGSGKGAASAWNVCLKAYGFTESEALAYQGNPIDNLAPLAKAGIPILHVVGDEDDIVPVAENTAIAEARYKELGGVMKVIHKPGVGHHPHSLEDPQLVVDYILAQENGSGTEKSDGIVGDKNFTLRGDYRNSRIQFERNRRGHVAFLGGSITEMEGYRPMVCEVLQKRFPETEFKFTNAGISSTCSDTGAFRLQRDVLSQGPLDLLFVEFAVNDDQDGEQGYNDALRGMEGVIAQARKHNPNVDIVMTFFANQNILNNLEQGQDTPSIAAHSTVAEHYGVSVNHLAQELADQIAAGKTTWNVYGGVHPKKHGNTMCVTMIANALLKEWAKPLPADAVPQAHSIVKPIDSKSYVNGRLLPFDDVKTGANWTVGVPDWAKENRGKVRPRFVGIPMICSSTPGAKLTVDFIGTAIGAYMLAGPDAAIIRCTVDGKETKEIDTLCKFSGFNYPVTFMFFSELEDGGHTLELEILDNRPGRSKPGGTALRVISFTGN
jgi:acetyl esterase/lipase/lysophospholipase L1-like esterase